MRFLCVLLIIGTLPLTAPAQPARPSGAPAGPAEVEAKRESLLAIARELRARPVADLDEARRAARAEAIAELERYADARRFTINDEFPGREVSYFVDGAGTRCQLASMIERSGDRDLLDQLVATENNAWVSQVSAHPRLLAWLAAHGFSIEEAAFIQGPGFVVPPLEVAPPPPPPPSADEVARRAGVTRPRPVTPSGPVRTGAPRASGRKRGGDGSTWAAWWEHHREEFVHVRSAYHDRSASTEAAEPGYDRGPARPRRPSAAQVRDEVIPGLAALAASDPDLAATAYMAMARAASGEQRAALRKTLLERLAVPSEANRDWMLLALAWARDPEAVPVLREVVRDTSAGRKLLARTSGIAESTRAIAALGLGRCGDPSAAADLLAVLQGESGALADLRASAITALGMLAMDAGVAAAARPVLARALADAGWPAEALAQVPLALARFGDRASLAPVLEACGTFKGSPLVRRSAAIALGRAAPFEKDVIDALKALAHRDPDAATRQFAICALGEVAARAAGGADAEQVERLATFFLDGIGGFGDPAADRPSHALAGAIFARKHSGHAAKITLALVELAKEGSVRDERAAALVALGLAGNAAAEDCLRAVWKGDGDAVVRAYAAEGLALCGNRTIVPALSELASSAPDLWVAQRAAQAIALLAGPELVGPLVESMAKTKSEPVRAGLTRAIGEIGDAGALPALLAVLRDPASSKPVRERAAAALGRIAQDDDLSWTAALRPGYNFTASTPSLASITSVF